MITQTPVALPGFAGLRPLTRRRKFNVPEIRPGITGSGFDGMRSFPQSSASGSSPAPPATFGYGDGGYGDNGYGGS